MLEPQKVKRSALSKSSPGYPVYQFRPAIDDLNIELRHVLSAIGYRNGDAPKEFVSMIGEQFELAKQHLDLRGGFVVLPPGNISAGSGQVHLKGIDFHTDKIVCGPLRKMETAALFAATVGPGFDTWSRSTFDSGDPLAGYLIDLIGSELAESLAEWLEAKIVHLAATKGEHCSNRYSPGYCGWSVAEQHKLFRFFPENFCGITLTDSALMIPHKSVSGIIGIGPEIRRKEYPCDVCNRPDCYKNRKNASIE